LKLPLVRGQGGNILEKLKLKLSLWEIVFRGFNKFGTFSLTESLFPIGYGEFLFPIGLLGRLYGRVADHFSDNTLNMKENTISQFYQPADRS
jgi:hypothetical protein